LPTLPTSLLIEKSTNPFLRCHLNQLHARAEEAERKILSDGEVFANLRRAKDQF
jgi:hydroxyacylglutathione hydrolase